MQIYRGKDWTVADPGIAVALKTVDEAREFAEPGPSESGEELLSRLGIVAERAGDLKQAMGQIRLHLGPSILLMHGDGETLDAASDEIDRLTALGMIASASAAGEAGADPEADPRGLLLSASDSLHALRLRLLMMDV